MTKNITNLAFFLLNDSLTWTPTKTLLTSGGGGGVYIFVDMLVTVLYIIFCIFVILWKQ